MSTRYATRVGRRAVVAGLIVVIGAVAAIIGLSTWLLPRATVRPALDAPAADDDATPGAVVCPDADLRAAGRPLTPSASQLIDCPDLYDGREVSFTGEIVEAVFDRGTHLVAVLNDDPYGTGPGPIPQTRTALGGNSGMTVLLPATTRGRIEHVGDYDTRGDQLRVHGVYRRASVALRGEPAIVAHRAVVVVAGGRIEHAADLRTVIAAASSLGIAVALVLANRSRRL